MGADRVCVESIPKARLRATSSVAVARTGNLRFVPGLAPKRETTGKEKEKEKEKGDAAKETESVAWVEPAGDVDSAKKLDSAVQDGAEKLESMSILDQLVAKYCPEDLPQEREEEDDDDDENDDEDDERTQKETNDELKEEGDSKGQKPGVGRTNRASRRQPGDPLAWFGTVVPPSLREAQREFTAAVAAAVEAAEARSKLLEALRKAERFSAKPSA